MIDGRMSIKELLARYPETMKVFDEFNMGCAGCEAALFENIEQGASVHGVDVERLLESLTKTVREG